MAALATLLLATWFITSSNSSTLVITTMLSMGSDGPPKRFRIVWCLGESVVAAVFLLVGGLKDWQSRRDLGGFASQCHHVANDLRDRETL